MSSFIIREAEAGIGVNYGWPAGKDQFRQIDCYQQAPYHQAFISAQSKP
jgi:hypothetical protein